MANDPEPPDPDFNKDLSDLVPHLAVPAPWNDNPPSFNLDPPPGAAPGNASLTDHPIVDVTPFAVNLSTLRNAVIDVTHELGDLVNGYEALRDFVLATKDSIFGQDALHTEYDDPGAASGGGGSGMPQQKTSPSPIQAHAREFAGHINPRQERVLEEIANSIEIVGRFTAGLDRAGEAYGAADRKAVFPEPPPSPVN